MKAIQRTFFNSPRVHWLRNPLAHDPVKQRAAVAAMLRTIFALESKADAEVQWDVVADAIRQKQSGAHLLQPPSGPGLAVAEAAAGAGAKAGMVTTHPIGSYTERGDRSLPGVPSAAPGRPSADDPELRPVPRPFAAERPMPRPGLQLVAVSTRSAPALPPRSDLAVPRPLPRTAPERRSLSPAEQARQRRLVAEAAALVEAPPTTLRGARDLACLAVSVYHEARDQPRLGQRAVASVILRRAEVPRWGETICEVVQPVQFSYLAPDRSFPPIIERAAWRTALTVAVEALVDGPVPDVAEADHYHASYVDPAWRREMLEMERIGGHIFYRDPRSRGLSDERS